MSQNTVNGRHNICGVKIAEHRKAMVPKMTQKDLAEKLQLQGIEIDKNTVQKIEAGKGNIDDIQLKAFAEFFGVSTDDLY